MRVIRITEAELVAALEEGPTPTALSCGMCRHERKNARQSCHDEWCERQGCKRCGHGTNDVGESWR